MEKEVSFYLLFCLRFTHTHIIYSKSADEIVDPTKAMAVKKNKPEETLLLDVSAGRVRSLDDMVRLTQSGACIAVWPDQLHYCKDKTPIATVRAVEKKQKKTAKNKK